MQSINIVSHRAEAGDEFPQNAPDASNSCTSDPRTTCSFRVSLAYQTNLVPIPNTSSTSPGRPVSHRPEAGDASFPQNAPDASPNCVRFPQPTGEKLLTSLRIIFRPSRVMRRPTPFPTPAPPGVK